MVFAHKRLGLVLLEKGRIETQMSAEDFVRTLLKNMPMKEAPLNTEVAIRSRTVPLRHQDPADRFIAATAIVYDLILVTADKRLLAAAGLKVIPAG